MRNGARFFVPLLGLLTALAGCTVHPRGERDERNASLQAGKAFEHFAALPENPTPQDLVDCALLNNADLQQRYWDWRSAIEQIPQDGTQPTNLSIGAGTTISNGSFSRDRTTLSASNDPMADIVWPQKLSAAAKRALQNARAAGLRFQKAKFDLRGKVLDAYYDYALTAELIRLEQANAMLLQSTATAIESRSQVGASSQSDLLKARNEIDLSRNDIENLKSQLPAERAVLNALMSRDPDSMLPLPAQFPKKRLVKYTDEQLLALAAKQNPELNALTHEIGARNESIQLAKLQYMPDFSLSAGTDLAGVSQTLAGMFTVPLLRYEAINAAVAQAEMNLKSIQAMRRAAVNDLNSQIIMDITALRDADRQLDLFQQSILPRAQQAVTLMRSGYEANQSTFLDIVDSEQSLIAVQKLVANMRLIREKRLNDIEKNAAVLVDSSG
jgi:cobalt-zinc-cadmium efflux system outer membrane protein